MKILGTTVVQDMENSAIERGVSVAALMEEAVEGCFDIILDRWKKPRHVLVLAGKGNNGNDALVLAGRLRRAGWPVTVLLSHPSIERKSLPVKSAEEVLEDAVTWPTKPGVIAFSDGKIVIDGLLGLGSKGFARGQAREILLWARSIRQPHDTGIALDFSSGLDADSGAYDEATFTADFTFCLGAIKTGCLKDNARPVTGRIFPVPLPLLSETPNGSAEDFFFTITNARQLARQLKPDAHKYTRGVVALWAGSPGMTGAASLAATAALHSGAGLVRLWTNDSGSSHPPSLPPEVMMQSNRLDLLQKPGSALVIGPGLGSAADTVAFFRELLPKIQVPAVFDAEALNLLSREPGLVVGLRDDAVLTPHGGEMKRLQGSESPIEEEPPWTGLHDIPASWF